MKPKTTPPIIPQVKPYGGVELWDLRNFINPLHCTCPVNVDHVHVAGCPIGDYKQWLASANAPPEKRKKILLSSIPPWTAPNPPKAPRPRSQRKHATNYKLLLQFNFHRPIDIDLWKRIKAPRGWRKCPTGRDAQQKYYGVRFQCRDLTHSLTPEEVETLRAQLYMALELRP